MLPFLRERLYLNDFNAFNAFIKFASWILPGLDAFAQRKIIWELAPVGALNGDDFWLRDLLMYFLCLLYNIRAFQHRNCFSRFLRSPGANHGIWVFI